METVWKAVSLRGRRYTSWAAYGWLEVVYEIGQTSRPPTGYLMAFSHPQAAQEFCAGSIGYIILEGDGEIAATVSQIPYILGVCALQNPKTVLAFWQKPHECSMRTPLGTVFLNSFTPKRVYAKDEWFDDD